MFLACRGSDWREVRLEDLCEHVAWLALPPAGRDGLVTVLPSAESYGAWRRWTAAGGADRLLRHQARHGADVGELLTTWQAGGRRNGGSSRPCIM